MKKQKLSKWMPGLIVLTSCLLTVLMVALGEDDEIMIHSVTPLSVETLTAKKTDYRIQVPAWGFVEPRETIDIKAEVSGKIEDLPETIFSGADVNKGDRLFQIDDRTYRNALKEATAAKNLAYQALEIEKGRQTIAKKEWDLLENAQWQGFQNKSLALREPQLKEREAMVQIAAAKEAQAALDVERARVKSPCSGVILSENLAEGKIIGTGDIGMKIACTDCYHITALFSSKYSIDPESQQAAVNIGSIRYEGRIKALLPQINPETLQKQILVEFEGKEVFMGAYVNIVLPGLFFKNAVVLPKEALRTGHTVWILSEGNTLEIRKVTLLAKDTQNVVIGEGIAEHERVILTHIASPLSGMTLSMLSQQPANDQGQK